MLSFLKENKKQNTTAKKITSHRFEYIYPNGCPEFKHA